MTNQVVNITVDSRESRSGIFEKLQRIPGAVVTQAELEIGDYVIGDDLLGVERKTSSDFIASIIDGRLFGQIALMKGRFPMSVILLEGDFRDIRSAIEPAALNGALSYIALLSGMQLLNTTDTSHTAEMLFRMAIHVQHGLPYEIALRAGKPKDLSSNRQYLVEGLSGIGPSSAKALLAVFKTPRAIFSASPAELARVKGVGPKTIARIQEILGD